METIEQKIQKALESLEEWAEEEDRSGDPVVYLVMYAMMKLREALKEAKE